jgi:hypothetical protein
MIYRIGNVSSEKVLNGCVGGVILSTVKQLTSYVEEH